MPSRVVFRLFDDDCPVHVRRQSSPAPSDQICEKERVVRRHEDVTVVSPLHEAVQEVEILNAPGWVEVGIGLVRRREGIVLRPVNLSRAQDEE